MFKSRLTGRRIQVLVGLVLLPGFLLQCAWAWMARSGPDHPAIDVPQVARFNAGVAFAAPSARADRTERLEDEAARDPLGFLQIALDRYDRGVHDYTCTFSKQERLNGRLSRDQVIAAFFREKPYSVRMEWKQNAERVSRVLYVTDRWIENGRRMAVVEPAGQIAQLFVSHVMRPIDDEEARKSSRRTIDQFGLRNTLVLTLKYAILAREKRLLDFAYQGNSEIAGRPTLVFERRLPYAGEDGAWPDRIQVLHLDRELLLPALSASYADDARQTLLGRYQYTDIKLNPNLPDAVFTKEGMGF